jgi:hypothetical protein
LPHANASPDEVVQWLETHLSVVLNDEVAQWLNTYLSVILNRNDVRDLINCTKAQLNKLLGEADDRISPLLFAALHRMLYLNCHASLCSLLLIM